MGTSWLTVILSLAAKNALRRKKVHEKNLEQTTAQSMQLEQQIYSIEAANINHETLAAMKQAGAAMKQIHGGMTLEDVDKTMCVTVLIAWELLYLQVADTSQGGTPRPARTQHRNRKRYRQRSHRRTAGRGRPRCRTGGAGAGGYGCQDGQHWLCTSGCPAGPVTSCGEHRS